MSAVRRLTRWSAAVVGLLLLLVLFVAAFRVVVYRQVDDPIRLAGKQAYLESIRAAAPAAGPNFVVVLFDDLGYGDLGAYGSSAIRTPHMDRLAREGVLLRNAYAASPYCSASRAALLTGRYAFRAELDHVVQAPFTWLDSAERIAGYNRRLPAEEITLAEVLSAAGYATAIFGKWHLGDRSPSLPGDLGFQTFYGLLHSNDQGKPVVWQDDTVVEDHPIEQSTLTRRYTERAVDFIERAAGQPFLLYLPHTFPHVPLHVADDRRGASPAGLYGDVVEELDWSVGQVVDALERMEIADQTLVLITSDNGPWFQGSVGAIRGRKMDVFEGGMRVPFIASWPGQISGGLQVDDLVMGIDIFPTLLELAGIAQPTDRTIDGSSLLGTLTGVGAPPHDALYFHQLGVPRAVRSGRFKYHDPHRIFRGNPMNWPWGPMEPIGPWLFDLERDPDESYDVSQNHPEVVERLSSMLDAWKAAAEENPRGWAR